MKKKLGAWVSLLIVTIYLALAAAEVVTVCTGCASTGGPALPKDIPVQLEPAP